jgi:hypothetical protein
MSKNKAMSSNSSSTAKDGDKQRLKKTGNQWVVNPNKM